jgi:arylsulfatase A-like enzyme
MAWGRALVLIAAGVLAAVPVRAACTTDACADAAVVSGVRARVATACDCARATRHGRYVRCAKREIKAAVSEGTLPRTCRKPVLRCEARSICGRPKAAVCCRATARGMVKSGVARTPKRCRGEACTASAFAAEACGVDGACVPPNVVVILVDDLGYADVEPFGGSLPTPNLRRLADEGMQLTDFYATAASCTPARAALMTGSYGQRVSVPLAYFPASENGLNPDEITIAEVLRERGYATGMFGKWHLGHLPPFLPTRQGFDEYFGIPYSSDLSPLHPLGPGLFPDLPLLEGEVVAELNPDQSQFTRRFTERAVDFIDRHAAEPFLLYLAHPMPHVPIFASATFAGRSGAGVYGDVVLELDWSVGEILNALTAHGLDARTIVLFASDNGPWLIMGNHGGSAGPLREGKNTAFDGGVRVSALVRWPGHVPAGSRSSEPMGLIDVLPTMARLAGAAMPDDRIIDGRDVWPILHGDAEARSPHEALFLYQDGELHSLRRGRWKLHVPHGWATTTEPGRDGHFGTAEQVTIDEALFDLDADPGETTNVAAAKRL